MFPMEETGATLTPTNRPAQTVALQPVYNQLYSLALLYKGNSMQGVSDWVQQSREKMTLEQLHRNGLVMNGLFYAFTTVGSFPSFGAYLDYLQSLPPESYQDRILSMYMRASVNGPCFMKDVGAPTPAQRAQILASVESYLAFLQGHFHAMHLDLELEAQAYSYVIDPPAMKKVIVDHLREMWELHLSAEWTRVRPMLAKSVEAFQATDVERMTRREAVRFVIGRDPPESHWTGQIDEAESLILVPNAHIGPYLGKFTFGSSLIVLFGARMPEGALSDVPDLSRTEILTRIGALSDDNRLRILRMAADAGEVRPTDVMAALDISQSAASRHLTQLTATGYLVERRRDGGKSYSLNPARIQDTLAALCRFLGVPAAST